VLSNGKRCPNEALPGSRYCGLPAHQELALRDDEPDDDELVAEAEPELEARADEAPAEPTSIGPESFEPVLETGDDGAEAAGPEPAMAEPDQVPAGIPIEPDTEEREDTPPAA
jgi:hypothetical protein